MNTFSASMPLLCLIVLALWGFLLLVAVEIWRVVLVAKGTFTLTDFRAGVEHGPEQYWRLNRAHLNVLEMLPIFGAIVLTGAFLNIASPSYSILAVVTIVSRLLQSGIHVASGSLTAVKARSGMFIIQLICVGSMGIAVLLDGLNTQAIAG